MKSVDSDFSPSSLSGLAGNFPPRVLLRASGLTVRFGGLLALDAVDFEVREGEIVGLIGPNGAGKTTFFNCLTGLVMPDEGEVRYKGQLLVLRPYKVAEAGLARTFQNIRLFPNMTPLENVLVGRHCHTKEGVWSALWRGKRFREAEASARMAAAEFLDFVGLVPDEDLSAHSLSYGDQRRLEIARALACEPGVLLLDEPTAGMNPRETQAMLELVQQIRDRGVAVVVIEHDMRFIFSLCDRIVVLDSGCKLSEGTSVEVRKDPRVIEAYLGISPE